MNEEKLLQILISICFTKSQANKRFWILREFLENKFFKKKVQKLENFLKKSNTSPDDTEALLHLPASFYSAFNKENTYPLLTKIDKALNKADSIHLYLPVDLTDKYLEKVGSWFKQNVGKFILLEIQTVKNLTLGITLSINGVYHDYSLKYFLSKKRQQINKAFEDYVKN